MNRIKQILSIIEYLFARLYVSLFNISNIWAISERGIDARDNGFIFFEYLRTKHPEINAKYIIDKGSYDYQKLTEYDSSIIQRNSFYHYVAIAGASHLISTHILGYLPHPEYYVRLCNSGLLLKKKKKIFLQHGIIKDTLPDLFFENTHLDLFICGAKYEYDFVNETFHYPVGVVQYTGLCRYDKLFYHETSNQILIMPTWRRYLGPSNFEHSLYFNTYRSLLTDERLAKLLKKHGLSLVFYPHHEFQRYIGLFRDIVLPDNIIIASYECDVQTLLKESKVLITDYSSVYFDMIYMKKPVLLFQFDETEYRKNHYSEGYFNTSRIGPKSITVESVIHNLEQIINNNYSLDHEYVEYISKMFKYYDTHNNDRVYDAIMKL